MYISCLTRPSKLSQSDSLQRMYKASVQSRNIKSISPTSTSNAVLLTWVTYDESSLISCKLYPKPGRLQPSFQGREKLKCGAVHAAQTVAAIFSPKSQLISRAIPGRPPEHEIRMFSIAEPLMQGTGSQRHRAECGSLCAAIRLVLWVGVNPMHG